MDVDDAPNVYAPSTLFLGGILLSDKAINIEANTDVNTLTDCGFYVSKSKAVSQSLTNVPSEISTGNYGFSFIVLSPYGQRNYTTQIIVAPSYGIFRRYRNASTWSSWYKATEESVS